MGKRPWVEQAVKWQGVQLGCKGHQGGLGHGGRGAPGNGTKASPNGEAHAGFLSQLCNSGAV